MCVSRDFGLVWNQNCCIFQDFGVELNLLYFPWISVCCGTKTAVFSRDFGLQRNQNCWIFKGIGSQTTMFSRILVLRVPELLYFSGVWGLTVPELLCFPGISNPHGAKTTVCWRDVVIIEPKLMYSPKDFGPQGAHACDFYFNSSMHNKSAYRNFLLIRNRARKNNLRNVIFCLFLNSWPKQKV